MNKTELMEKASRTLSKVSFGVKKHSPEILVGAGVVGVVASAVMACIATTKVNGILEEAKATVDAIHQIADDPEKEYTKEDASKALTITYAKTGLELAALYAPSVLLGAASITCILASNNILHKRNVALAAAYTTVDKSFKEYRGRLIERFGKELDKELRYNIKEKEIEEIVKDEDGNETVVKKTVSAANPSEISDYTKCFDETCFGWSKSPEHNLAFIKGVQAWANQKLQADGYLFLNEVYEALGFPKTEAGQAVGWLYSDDKYSDNYVDFGIYDLHNEEKRNFVNGYERSIWLDFNVDGVIWKDAFRK